MAMALTLGDAVYNLSSEPQFSNCIFWGTNDQISDDATATPVISECIIQGGYSGPGTATNILDTDPLYIDPDNGDFHLHDCSPAIDVGSIVSIPNDAGDGDNDNNSGEQIDYDFDLNTRVVNGEVDLGALEFQGILSDYALDIDSTNVSCNGLCDGTATANVSGGTPGYNVSWSTGGATASISALCPGTYSVTATDAIGCTLIDSVFITELPPVTINASNDTTICNGQAATISATASGGTESFSYIWDNGVGAGAVQSVSPATTTMYIVTATDGNNCEVLDTVVVTVDDGPLVDISGDSILCAGESSTLDAGNFRHLRLVHRPNDANH